MNKFSEIVDLLEVKFFKLHQKVKRIEQENTGLKQQLESTEQINKNLLVKVSQLELSIENLKVVNTLLGSEENKRETKLKINTLIREIDYCIAQLSD